MNAPRLLLSLVLLGCGFAAGLVITGQGTALRSAGEGEVIRVRNVDSGTIVSGVVASDGSIRITG